MEKMIRFGGAINGCRKCGKQPSVFENQANGGVRFSCHPCGVRLWEFPTLQEALQHWEDVNPQPLDQFIPAAA
jgi:hypothetical protein